MLQEREKTSNLLITSVILGDIIIMLTIFVALNLIWTQTSPAPMPNILHWDILLYYTLCYIISTYHHGVVLHLRKTRNRDIIGRVFRNSLKFAAISIAFMTLMGGYENIPTRFLITFHIILFLALIIWRFICNKIVRTYRKKGRNYRTCIFLGGGPSVIELCQEMVEKEAGYRLMGYFDKEPNEQITKYMPYLGKPENIISYLERHSIHQVYSTLTSDEKSLIRNVIYWTENNFAYFYHVPHVRNYLQRRMWFETIGDVPVLSLHVMPLNSFDNRFIKRAFDLIMSSLFLFTVFPFIYLFVGIIIKITSPGPIFFKQKRNGINGEEFWCYKFRSMKVNKDADKVQATKNDPRKTKFGDFMRKTNIDELPQLINVFLGDMSLVGPRPHMLKHTEEYSQLISTYMVRHFVKPGITGWAQVTGFRGETKELHQMEGRVKADIWYMEHWSFLLDLNIIYKTFANVIKGEKEAY